MAFWNNWGRQPAQTQQTQPTDPYVGATGLATYNAAMAAGKTYSPGYGYVSPQLLSNTVTATPPGGQTQPSWSNWGESLAGYEPVAGRRQAGGTQPSTPAGLAGTTVNGGLPLGFESYTDPTTGINYYIGADGGWHVAGESPTTANTAMTEYQKAMIDYQLQELAATQGLNEDELALRRQQMYQDAAYQNAQLAFQQQQWNQQQAQEQKNYLANLAAEPHSWLEYAAASGQSPVIQPWMLPLESQQYSNLQAGQTIPGWSSTDMTGMSQLINPSAQYFARMGPTAQQQYYGYQQGQQGMTPEESQWRLWSMAPPSGGQGLTQVR